MKKRTAILLAFAAVVLAACIEDKSRYDYRQTNEVTFLSVPEGFSSTFGEEAEYVAPIEFSEPFANEEDIDKVFEIQWFIGEELVATGYRIRYTFSDVGGFSLVLKVVNRETGETYISDGYSMESKSSIGCGWMILAEKDGGESSLSFISPSTLSPMYRLEEMMLPEDESLGTGPKRLFYYYVMGSIPNNYVSGLPKIILNQDSGTVTLDGSNLMKDRWMRDEFQSGAEPEADFSMSGFAWKRSYYLICTESGNVYMRCMDRTYESIPYYGTYSSMPFDFTGGAHISYFQGFQNVSYWAADEDVALMYDDLNGRFLCFVPGGYGDDYESYSPKVVYLGNYDKDLVLGAGVPRVDAMGTGTRCIAAGAYEKVYVDPEMGGLEFYPSYLALVDLGGAADYRLFSFTVRPLGAENHVITESSISMFSGGSLLTGESIVRMSSNFEKKPFFYFTDGDRNLYVYSVASGTHRLAYTASSAIISISPSPIVSEFSGYGGNSESFNHRIAVGQEDGSVSILDVSDSRLVQLFEGLSPTLEIKTISGFGEIKDMVWATNYQGEY